MRNELNNRKVVIIAHRGAKRLAPENTLKAFKKAIELNADYVEFDTRLSKDREIVLMHDATTLRTTGHIGRVKKMTLDDLKKLNCGEKEKIPTLLELIELAKEKIGLWLEIKTKGQTEKVVRIIKENRLVDSIIVSSFHHRELLRIQKLEPKIKLSALVFGIKKNKTINEAMENKFYAIQSFHRFINMRFINIVHDNNIKVLAWNVSSKAKMRRLIDWGVDGLDTNDIKASKELLNR
ncbi:MAG TPA: glycerophosphodiester phosphodiesterase family protein [Candidatus Lokiarchaeia archaeon]